MDFTIRSSFKPKLLIMKFFYLSIVLMTLLSSCRVFKPIDPSTFKPSCKYAPYCMCEGSCKCGISCGVKVDKGSK